MKRKAIFAGGGLNALFAIFHASFPSLFQWRETLATLSPLNRAIMYALACHATLIIATFAYVSFAYAKELCENPLGRFLARIIALYYGLRIVEEWTLFCNPPARTLVLSVVCGGVCALYLYGSTGSLRTET